MGQGDPGGSGRTQQPPRPTMRWHALTALWAIPAALSSATIDRGFLVLVLGFLGVLLAVVWCSDLLRVLLDREARGRLTWKAAAHWAVCPGAGLLVAALYLSPWPYALRVKLSEPALLRLVDDVGAGRAHRVPTRAGLILVDSARAEGGSVRLYTETGLIFSEYGLAYSRDGSRPRSSRRHLFGRWYVFEEHG